jgi:hypothetical protein
MLLMPVAAALRSLIIVMVSQMLFGPLFVSCQFVVRPVVLSGYAAQAFMFSSFHHAYSLRCSTYQSPLPPLFASAVLPTQPVAYVHAGSPLLQHAPQVGSAAKYSPGPQVKPTPVSFDWSASSSALAWACPPCFEESACARTYTDC